MKLTQSRKNDFVILAVEGRVDNNTTPLLEEKVQNILDAEQGGLLMDFSDLDYINSSGLRILVMAFQKLNQSGGKLRLCGLKDYILEVFQISGYDKIFQLYPTREEALQEAGA